MNFIVVENGEAFFISDESWLDFLEMRAAGRGLDLHRYGTYIGEVRMDVTKITPDQAMKMSNAIRMAGHGAVVAA